MPKRNVHQPSDSDMDSHSDASSARWYHTDNESYDEWGQARGGGIGQGAPHNENGCYIYSQVGMPVIGRSPLPSVSIPKVNEGLPVSDCTTELYSAQNTYKPHTSLTTQSQTQPNPQP